MKAGIILLAGLTGAVLVHAQSISVGVEGGVPVQTPLTSTSSVPFAVGPTVELHIIQGLSLKSGFVYHGLGNARDNMVFTTSTGGNIFAYSSWSGSAFDIPILAKYRFLRRRHTLRPFIEVGPAIRLTSISYNFTSYNVGGGGALIPTYRSGKADWNVDPMAGVGLDVRAGRIHIEPEVRYYYWNAGDNGTVRKNQVEVLFGLRF